MTHTRAALISASIALAMPANAIASAITNASISITELTITADQNFALLSDNGVVNAKAGLDSFGAQNAQNLSISGSTSANAIIPTATALANSTISVFYIYPTQSYTLPGSLQATSGINLGGTSDSSQSSGLSAPIFEFQAPFASPTNPIHLTFSMTLSGSLDGTADAIGSYSDEISAEFSYQSNDAPFDWIPVDSFDQTFSGGPSDNKNLAVASQTLSNSFTLDSSGDFFFQASASAQSNATNGPAGSGGTTVPEPLTLSLYGAGLVGAAIARRRRNRRA